MSTLISTEAQATRAHITDEALVLRNEMKTTSQVHETHVEAQHLATRDHITAESSKIKEHIESELQSDIRRKEREALRTRVLSTLWFPEMNARENDIREVPEETVKWIFDEDNDCSQNETATRDLFPPKYIREDAVPRRSSQFREWLQVSDPVFWIR